ncbi:hypothetical protein F2P44_16185 [Massilia sp. CCM 8695]|uniref:Baseplate assembly protein n=1 Tax=Massilia frigida TaxID=2609281 RepID=A0ABX0NI84_9BURK|nr:hypothetical protein [Massilia frigida]NHZ80800.1 hypothetical protein [Massilia frigida]
MACNPLITDAFDFPRRASNRPGLARIAYRIGRYPDFVEAMMRNIDAAPELAAWTHRDPDDPGIALLQGAAILGDILAFYQEHYANEAFLRTAAWRESVAELVRLTGYRLAPGIGGRATLAIEARGSLPVTIHKGFPVKAELKDLPVPADFQTDAELIAWPHLGRFNLYRARRYPPRLGVGATSFDVAGIDGAADSASLAAFELKAGERLLLLPPEPAWTSVAGAIEDTQAPQVVKVKNVTRLLGRVIVEIEGALQSEWNQPVRAYRINRSFRHFGHNAPPKTVATIKDNSGKITGSSESDTAFYRHVDAGHDCVASSASTALTPVSIPLDTEVGDLHEGMRVVVQVRLRLNTVKFVALSVVRTVVAQRGQSIGFGNLHAASTLLTLDQPLIKYVRSPSSGTLQADVRDYRIFEVTSAPLALQPVSSPEASGFADGTDALAFYGKAVEAQALAGRRLWLSRDDDAVELVCNNQLADFAAATPDVARMWLLSFNRAPAPFVHADFDEAAPTVTVFGNLVDASQGKVERDAVLGNGDQRQRWQTFALPKAPLTYFLSAATFPPHAPALEIWVNARLWRRVDAFYGHGPADTIYIVREDGDDRSFVQFGDGETGARLPSGLNNVVAQYRSGSGAHGPIKPGATPTASERPPGFDKLSLAGIVSGGAAPEDAEKAREAAPGKVQSLGRLVSIADYETETLAVPGVVAASAAWDLADGVPAVILRVLLAAGRETEFEAVRKALVHAQRCRGPDRFALVIEQAWLRYAFVDVVYARDPRYRQADIEADIFRQLGLSGVGADERKGMFGLHARRLGQPEYASGIEGRLQNVAGVVWCKVSALGLFGTTLTDPAAQPLPAAPRTNAAVLPCAPRELLQLAKQHLSISCVDEPSAGECA